MPPVDLARTAQQEFGSSWRVTGCISTPVMRQIRRALADCGKELATKSATRKIARNRRIVVTYYTFDAYRIVPNYGMCRRFRGLPHCPQPGQFADLPPRTTQPITSRSKNSTARMTSPITMYCCVIFLLLAYLFTPAGVRRGNLCRKQARHPPEAQSRSPDPPFCSSFLHGRSARSRALQRRRRRLSPFVDDVGF